MIYKDLRGFAKIYEDLRRFEKIQKLFSKLENRIIGFQKHLKVVRIKFRIYKICKEYFEEQVEGPGHKDTMNLQNDQLKIINGQ